MFPCFDEPSYRAVFRMKLKYNSQFNATYFVTKDDSSLVESTPGENGITWKTTTYRPTARMAPYALAFLISDFQRKGLVHDEYGNDQYLEIHRCLFFLEASDFNSVREALFLLFIVRWYISSRRDRRRRLRYEDWPQHNSLLWFSGVP